MKTVIVNGGNIEYDFALSFFQKHAFDYVIAADHGAEFLYRAGICPDELVGDFDSADQRILPYYQERKVPIRRFRPEKDSTDMEIAMLTALERGSTSITVLGATGSRLDHVLGSIRNLSSPLSHGVACEILDSHNRIRMVDRNLTIRREEQFGKYVSLLAHAGPVEHLTLRGFYYPLTDYRLEPDCAMGISNEITEEEAEIRFERGKLLVIESRD